MACLLRFSDSTNKGIVTFTTLEWNLIRVNTNLLLQLQSLREKYVIGLHFNWHNYQFDRPDEFDFFMAGSDDLRAINNKPYRLLPMDACNFTPAAYRPAPAEEKFWDVLVVGNPVFFKRPEVVLRTVRELFDRSDSPLQVLYICPMPQYRFMDEDTVFYDVREYYEALFSVEERSRFTLLTTNFDSPNPFDRKALSVFFRNSKVFLHCATEERRCRIAAYAWAAGLPVVAYPSVASILPESLRKAPAYYCVERDEEYAEALLSALNSFKEFDATSYRRVVSEADTIKVLDQELSKIFKSMLLPYGSTALMAQNLDRRLGWHHQGISGLANGVGQSLADFMSELVAPHNQSYERQQHIRTHDYPERVLANELDSADIVAANKVLHRSVYLNPAKRRWLGRIKVLKSRLMAKVTKK